MRMQCIQLLVLLHGVVPGGAATAPPSWPQAHCLASSPFPGKARIADLLQRPIPLTHWKQQSPRQVTSDSSTARAYYEQGIAYLFSYSWLQAGRSFNESLRHDPQLVMSRLGLTKAFVGLEALEEADQELIAAAELAAQAKYSEKERLWIALARKQLQALSAASAEQKRLHLEYKEAIEEYIRLYPDDPDAWVLRGNAEEGGPWGRGQGGLASSLAWYEGALRIDRHHMGAHHFLAHTYENLNRLDPALDHARKYAAYAPEVPHAHHMLGHVAADRGSWQTALANFKEADRLHRRRLARDGEDPEEDWHYGHNLRLLSVTHFLAGNHEQAEKIFKETYSLRYDGWRKAFYCIPWIEYLLSQERFSDALSKARSCEQPTAIARTISEALSGEALLGLGRHQEAEQASARATAAYEELRAQATASPETAALPGLLRPYLDTLAGRIALRKESPLAGDAALLTVANDVLRNPRFDFKGEGLFRVGRIMADARSLRRSALLRDLETSIHGLDAPFRDLLLPTVADRTEHQP